MVKAINFHYTQLDSIDFLVDSINQNKRVVALIGAGGVGKSEILSVLEDNYHNSLNEFRIPKNIFMAATTNKAVSRLLQVVDDAKTVHSLTARPKYTALYEELEAFYCQLQDEKDKESFASSFTFKFSKSFISRNRIILENHRSINDLLAHLRMSPFSEEMFDRYILNDRQYNSVIVIDEASMLPTESVYDKGSLITIGLDSVSQVFDIVIIVGDDRQLDPVNGKSSFGGIESYELTKNFRSELDLLEAIQWARDGKRFSTFKSQSENVKVVMSLPNGWYQATFGKTNVVHIVYTNKTRHQITKNIRGNRNGNPEQGEPVLLRGRGNEKVSKGELGIFDYDMIKFEKGEIYLKDYHCFDEYANGRYGIFQFGYALTCHNAQGSSFDHVIVHAYDIPYFLTDLEKEKWIYTAVSRARKTLTIIL